MGKGEFLVACKLVAVRQAGNDATSEALAAASDVPKFGLPAGSVTPPGTPPMKRSGMPGSPAVARAHLPSRLAADPALGAKKIIGALAAPDIKLTKFQLARCVTAVCRRLAPQRRISLALLGSGVRFS